MKTEDTQIRLKDYRPPDFAIDTVHLDFRLAPRATAVTATLALRPTGGSSELKLDGDELTLVSIAIDGESLDPARYQVSADGLVISEVPDQPFELKITTEIDPTGNTKLMGLFRSGGTYCTQCEAEGFRRITYFLDRPDVLSVYTTRIEAPVSEAPVLLANGNMIDSGQVEGSDRHFAVWHDPFPKPAYLFAVVGGDLGLITDRFTTASGRAVELRIYCEHGKQDQCAYAMDALKRSMRWDEQAYGREYDLDIFMIVAVSDFNMGAMENKGLNIFNRHSPDDIQIRGNRTTGPPPRERHLLLQPSDGLILVSGLRLEGHSVIFLAIQTHLSCRFLLTVDFLGPTPERVLAADHRSAVGFSETGRGSPPPPPIGT